MALNNLAWVYQQQGDERGAAAGAAGLCAVAQRADRGHAGLDPDDQRRCGQRRAAAAPGRPSRRRSDPRIVYHFAVALKDTGDKDEAIKELTSLSPERAEFKEKDRRTKAAG